MKSKIITLLLLFFIFTSPLVALDFGRNVENVKMDNSFGWGYMPVLVDYEFWVKGLSPLIKGNTTSLYFNFYSGYGEREVEVGNDDIEYGVIHGYVDAVFTQGFRHNKYNGKDLFRVWARYAARMEQAINSIKGNQEGFNSIDAIPYAHQSLSSYESGDVDLIGNMSQLSNVFTIGVDFPWRISTVAGYNNYRHGFSFDFSPKVINDIFSDSFNVPVGYRRFYYWMDRYLTLYEKPKANGLNLFSVMEENNISFTRIEGDYVPSQAGGTTFHNSFCDDFSLVFYGPHFMSKETIPSLTLGLNSTFGFGNKTNNSSNNVGYEFDSNIYMKFHFMIFNVFHLEYKIKHELFYTNNKGEDRFWDDGWNIPPSLTFYISL